MGLHNPLPCCVKVGLCKGLCLRGNCDLRGERGTVMQGEYDCRGKYDVRGGAVIARGTVIYRGLLGR